MRQKQVDNQKQGSKNPLTKESLKTDSSGKVAVDSNVTSGNASGFSPRYGIPPVAQAKEKKPVFKKFVIFGIICIVMFFVGLSIAPGSGTINTTPEAQTAIETQVSTMLPVGTILMKTDESLGGQDITIEHESEQGETKIWVWDYAAEDGDYVQILVNGVPAGDAFMIKHKPREFTVPSVGEVQIKGIRDGGGGITYAVHYELNKTTYFNTAPEGGANAYTLVLKLV